MSSQDKRSFTSQTSNIQQSHNQPRNAENKLEVAPLDKWKFKQKSEYGVGRIDPSKLRTTSVSNVKKTSDFAAISKIFKMPAQYQAKSPQKPNKSATPSPDSSKNAKIGASPNSQRPNSLKGKKYHFSLTISKQFASEEKFLKKLQEKPSPSTEEAEVKIEKVETKENAPENEETKEKDSFKGLEPKFSMEDESKIELGTEIKNLFTAQEESKADFSTISNNPVIQNLLKYQKSAKNATNPFKEQELVLKYFEYMEKNYPKTPQEEEEMIFTTIRSENKMKKVLNEIEVMTNPIYAADKFLRMVQGNADRLVKGISKKLLIHLNPDADKEKYENELQNSFYKVLCFQLAIQQLIFMILTLYANMRKYDGMNLFFREIEHFLTAKRIEFQKTVQKQNQGKKTKREESQDLISSLLGLEKQEERIKVQDKFFSNAQRQRARANEETNDENSKQSETEGTEDVGAIFSIVFFSMMATIEHYNVVLKAYVSKGNLFKAMRVYDSIIIHEKANQRFFKKLFSEKFANFFTERSKLAGSSKKSKKSESEIENDIETKKEKFEELFIRKMNEFSKTQTNVQTFNILMFGFGQKVKSLKDCLGICTKMKQKGVKWDFRTFHELIAACFAVSDVEKAREVFKLYLAQSNLALDFNEVHTFDFEGFVKNKSSQQGKKDAKIERIKIKKSKPELLNWVPREGTIALFINGLVENGRLKEAFWLVKKLTTEVEFVFVDDNGKEIVNSKPTEEKGDDDKKFDGFKCITTVKPFIPLIEHVVYNFREINTIEKAWEILKTQFPAFENYENKETEEAKPKKEVKKEVSHETNDMEVEQEEVSNENAMEIEEEQENTAENQINDESNQVYDENNANVEQNNENYEENNQNYDENNQNYNENYPNNENYDENNQEGQGYDEAVEQHGNREEELGKLGQNPTEYKILTSMFYGYYKNYKFLSGDKNYSKNNKVVANFLKNAEKFFKILKNNFQYFLHKNKITKGSNNDLKIEMENLIRNIEAEKTKYAASKLKTDSNIFLAQTQKSFEKIATFLNQYITESAFGELKSLAKRGKEIPIKFLNSLYVCLNQFLVKKDCGYAMQILELILSSGNVIEKKYFEKVLHCCLENFDFERARIAFNLFFELGFAPSERTLLVCMESAANFLLKELFPVYYSTQDSEIASKIFIKESKSNENKDTKASKPKIYKKISEINELARDFEKKKQLCIFLLELLHNGNFTTKEHAQFYDFSSPEKHFHAIAAAFPPVWENIMKFSTRQKNPALRTQISISQFEIVLKKFFSRLHESSNWEKTDVNSIFKKTSKIGDKKEEKKQDKGEESDEEADRGQDDEEENDEKKPQPEAGVERLEKQFVSNKTKGFSMIFRKSCYCLLSFFASFGQWNSFFSIASSVESQQLSFLTMDFDISNQILLYLTENHTNFGVVIEWYQKLLSDGHLLRKHVLAALIRRCLIENHYEFAAKLSKEFVSYYADDIKKLDESTNPQTTPGSDNYTIMSEGKFLDEAKNMIFDSFINYHGLANRDYDIAKLDEIFNSLQKNLEYSPSIGSVNVLVRSYCQITPLQAFQFFFKGANSQDNQKTPIMPVAKALQIIEEFENSYRSTRVKKSTKPNLETILWLCHGLFLEMDPNFEVLQKLKMFCENRMGVDFNKIKTESNFLMNAYFDLNNPASFYENIVSCFFAFEKKNNRNSYFVGLQNHDENDQQKKKEKIGLLILLTEHYMQQLFAEKQQNQNLKEFAQEEKFLAKMA